MLYSECISILMPVYNAAEYLPEAIKSILNQTDGNFQLIIIDDGSTDNSLNTIKSFAIDARIKVVAHDNMGMGNSLNHALEFVNSEWLMRMDADDVMMPNRIASQRLFISENPDLAVAGSLVYYIDSKSRIIGKSVSELTTRSHFNRMVDKKKMFGLHHPSTVIKTKILKNLGGYRSEFWPAEDIDLWNRITEAGETILVQPQYLLKYRIHTNSISISSAMKARQKYLWAKSCMQLRQMKKEEISWEEFLSRRKEQNIFNYLKTISKDYSIVLYKSAVIHYSSKRYLKFIAFLFISVVLSPVSALKLIWKKISI